MSENQTQQTDRLFNLTNAATGVLQAILEGIQTEMDFNPFTGIGKAARLALAVEFWGRLTGMTPPDPEDFESAEEFDAANKALLLDIITDASLFAGLGGPDEPDDMVVGGTTPERTPRATVVDASLSRLVAESTLQSA